MKTVFMLLSACLLVLAMAAPTHAQSDRSVEFHGSVDLTAIDYGNDGYEGGRPVFDMYKFHFICLGDVSRDVSFFVHTTFQHSGEEIEVEQGYLTWSLHPSLNIQMGKFYTPIGYYWRDFYETTRRTASKSFAMRMINVTPWSEAGVMLHGEIPVSEMKLNYRAAMINGLDEDYIENIEPRQALQNRDNNKNKMFVGRIGFVPVHGLEVGVSYANGRYDDDATRDIQFLDADFSLGIADLLLRGEWIQSEAEAITTEDKVKTSGFYTFVAYRAVKERFGLNYIEPIVGYESLDPGRDMVDRFAMGPETTGKVTGFSMGLNVSPREHLLFKTEYRMVKEENDPQLENDAFFFQGCIDF